MLDLTVPAWEIVVRTIVVYLSVLVLLRDLLGQTLVDFFALAQEAVAKQYADTTNEHVIEDLIDVNFSIDESAPLLKFST